MFGYYFAAFIRQFPIFDILNQRITEYHRYRKFLLCLIFLVKFVSFLCFLLIILFSTVTGFHVFFRGMFFWGQMTYPGNDNVITPVRYSYLFDRVNLGLDWLRQLSLQVCRFGNWKSSSALPGVNVTLLFCNLVWWFSRLNKFSSREFINLVLKLHSSCKKFIWFSISSILLLHSTCESLLLLHSCMFFISLLRSEISWRKKICRVSILFAEADLSSLGWIMSFARELFVVSLMFEFSPELMKDTFELQSPSYNLRSSCNQFRKETIKAVHYGLQSLKYVGPKIWELLPNNIKYSNSLSKFKKLIKLWKPEACPCRLCKTTLPK